MDFLAWDQSQKFVKFYITLPKVNTVPAENVQCDFQEKSLELKVKNLENKDYVFKVTQLLYTVEPKSSTYKVIISFGVLFLLINYFWPFKTL